MEQKKEISKVQELVYELKIEQVMTRNVVTVTPDNLISELRDLLRNHRISGVPVVEDNKLVGIVSIEDFIKCLAKGEIDSPVKNKMTREVQILYADEPLINAIQKFDEYGFGRFPIIDRQQGNLVGIITKGDIIEGLLRQLEVNYHEEEIHRYRASHIFDDIIADQSTLRLQYDIAGKDFKRAGTASSGLKTTLRRLGINPEVVRRVAIASYEAEMNIVIYTDGGTIAAEARPDQVKLEATDNGPGIPDIAQAMQPGFSTAPEWVRELGFGAGMGLNNIQRCADVMDLQSEVGKGTHLTTIFYLQGGKNDKASGPH
ncbi:MAG: CBS domain-containing protein [candidate division KSB1 bacterium]|nr:CBS domain-containing protein [candidate division KSB1 bacterium]MDZ7303533.1 CBS domain-containing protein [candidate division KSB1 bacterium]MDZ7312665.1 CBS domain-containing protein [candidate division KSB1 bacterium]